MKQILFFPFVLFFAVPLQAQVDTLQLGDRLPNLYYWDTNWIDSKLSMYPYCITTLQENLQTGNVFWGRPCVTDVPLKVIGIAAPVYFHDKSEYANGGVLDTDFTHRLPEYFRLYQVEQINKDYDTLFLKAEGRWDTTIPQYEMVIPVGASTDSSVFPLYEIFFDPVYVHDTFVVGGTTCNNKRHGYDSDMFPDDPDQYSLWFTYVLTLYPFITCGPYPPTPKYVYYKNQVIDPGFLHAGSDTTFQKLWFGWNLWLPFFAIFDTNYVPGVGTYDDSCMAPTGLYIEEQNHWGTTLSWDAGGDSLWQLLVTPQGTPIEEGVPLWTPVNYKTLTDLDTGQWYVARVRTFCDTDIFGPWSDSLLFYVAGDECSMPFGLHVAALDSGSVTLAWNNADVLLWEVELGLDDLGMSNAQTTTVTTNTLQVDGLYPDMWYWARVRALCDTDWYSDWTDTIHFLVPNHHVDTTNAINPVEQYTYLMPNPAREEVAVLSSFKVRSVELYASDGKLLKEQEVNGLGTRLSLEGLPAGVYFVRVRTSAGVTTKRLVVE